MAGYRLRSWQRHSVGRALVTVTLEPRAGERSVAAHRGLADVTERLIGRLNKLEIPATWGVSDPGHSTAVASVATSGIRKGVEHEIAILGDDSWVGPNVGRAVFSQELAVRVAQARAKRLPTTTLISQTSISEHLDLVVKQGITAVCPTSDGQLSASRTTAPRAVHFGVWQLAIHDTLPRRVSWFGRKKVLRAIKRSAQESSLYHLHINASDLVDASLGAASMVDKALAKIADYRNRGMLEIETASTVAARLSDVPTAQPQKSLLKVA